VEEKGYLKVVKVFKSEVFLSPARQCRRLLAGSHRAGVLMFIGEGEESCRLSLSSIS